jgi:glutathione peroxidase-family protein
MALLPLGHGHPARSQPTCREPGAQAAAVSCSRASARRRHLLCAMGNQSAFATAAAVAATPLSVFNGVRGCDRRRPPPAAAAAAAAAAPARSRRNRGEQPTCRTRRRPRIQIKVPESLDQAGIMTLLDGSDFDFADTKGKVVLAVNVATLDKAAEEHFETLNDLHKRYHQAGLIIIAFPSNWFGQYEPGSDERVAQRISEFDVKFPVMSKLANFDVEANPVFELGISAFPGDIIWNFQGKFLFDRSGKPVARFDLLSTDEFIGVFSRARARRRRLVRAACVFRRN